MLSKKVKRALLAKPLTSDDFVLAYPDGALRAVETENIGKEA